MVCQKEGVLEEVIFGLVSDLEVVKLGVCSLSVLSEVICCYSLRCGIKFSSLSQLFIRSLRFTDGDWCLVTVWKWADSVFIYKMNGLT